MTGTTSAECATPASATPMATERDRRTLFMGQLLRLRCRLRAFGFGRLEGAVRALGDAERAPQFGRHAHRGAAAARAELGLVRLRHRFGLRFDACRLVRLDRFDRRAML